MKREFSAGGVVFRKTEKGLLFLLRRPTPNDNYRGNLGWSLPKGWIDDREGGKIPGPKACGEEKSIEDDLRETAVREVAEEGGVAAKIISKLKTVKIFFTNTNQEKVMKFVTYFLMEYESEIPEGFGFETAEIKWVSEGIAQELLVYKSEKELVDMAMENLNV